MDTNKLMALLPDIAAFVTVVEAGSFTAASQRLGMTPSGVSRQISRLEAALNADLLERTTRKQVTTDTGKVVYEFSKKIMESASDIANIASQEGGEAQGELRISAPKAFSHHILEPLMLPFLDLYPKVKLRLLVSDEFVDPFGHNLDIVFELTHFPRENLVAKTLGEIKAVLCASKSYLQEHGIPFHPNNLLNHNCLFLNEQPNDNVWLFNKDGENVKVQVDGRYSVNHSEMRLNAVKSGIGIGIFPEFVVEKALREGDVLQVLPEWHINSRYQGEIVMQFPQSKFMPARRRAFIDYMVASMKPTKASS
ncbi:putative transcriptional regulator, LysR family protein [Vibrio mediterranei AK1]|uniref:LysR family transcriptional regulator n=1 Tax=Vibrio mediterranei TaxID=689 RepID=UPI00015426DD|nr:LysR family transcriptional regulator [Vibrio mediterranei]EDL52265.1 putative transcriptional regulator, LysR family protein [Vibrio mediterranei AK1]